MTSSKILSSGKCFCGADIGGLKHNLVKGNRRLDGYNKFNEKGEDPLHKQENC